MPRARPAPTAALTALLLIGCATAGAVGLTAGPADAQPAGAGAGGGYTARVTQVDRSRFPKITTYVSITGADGGPVAASADLTAEVLEGDVVVHRGPLFAPAQRPQLPVGATSVALVLDCSGSMAPDKNGDKFGAARAAARTFIERAPAGYSFAVVAFNSQTTIECPLTDDRAKALHAIDLLRPDGATAFQDGVGAGLGLVRGRPGRRLVLALTDGEENASAAWKGPPGKLQLLSEAAQDDTSISVIGLGGDVKGPYLQEFQQTGGFYLFSPSDAELQGRFQEVQDALRSEWQFEHTSPSAADGSRRPVVVRVLRSGQTVAEDRRRYVSPGLVPSVRGAHWPFVLLLGAMALAPWVARAGAGALATRRFRERHLIALPMADACVGRSDPNGTPLCAGDPVVRCPSCAGPHHARSWRLNNCKCMRDGHGTGRLCYHAALPRWVRRFLDWASGRASGPDGRRWLCRCAGDDEGY